MPATGRLFLKIDPAVDERNDPLRATEAAAQLLKLNYDSLGAWPLAVTAYNHGRKGMMRAVRRVGSMDLEDLIVQYRSRSFGFASSNFYSNLVAAIHVQKHARELFGEFEGEIPPAAVEVPLRSFVNLPEMAGLMKLDLRRLRELNPGIADEVFAGRLFLPAGYRLRLPRSEGQDVDRARQLFEAQFEVLPAIYKSDAQISPYPGKKRSGNRRRGKRL
jgi:membrane-bound lytic murein transglycosylase D